MSITSRSNETRVFTERVEDEWLILEAVLDESDTGMIGKDPSLETLLRWNRALARGAKFALRADRRVCLRAELPWAEERISAESRDAAAAGIAEGRELWLAGASHADANGATALPEPAPASAELKRACAESGWNVTERPDGILIADLEVRSGFYQAHCETPPASCCRVLAELAALESGLGRASSRAVAVLLLLAGAAVRWARPEVIAKGSQRLAVFAVHLPTPPAPADIADALSSLSVACQLCGEEIKALFSETTARDYLEVGSWLSQHT